MLRVTSFHLATLAMYSTLPVLYQRVQFEANSRRVQHFPPDCVIHVPAFYKLISYYFDYSFVCLWPGIYMAKQQRHQTGAAAASLGHMEMDDLQISQGTHAREHPCTYRDTHSTEQRSWSSEYSFEMSRHVTRQATAWQQKNISVAMPN